MKKIKIFGICLLTFVLVANLQFSFLDYGVTSNSLGNQLIAQTNTDTSGGDTGGETGEDTGGDSNGTGAGQKYYREVLTARHVYIEKITGHITLAGEWRVGMMISFAVRAQLGADIIARESDDYKIICHADPAGNWPFCTAVDWSQCANSGCPTPTNTAPGGGTT